MRITVRSADEAIERAVKGIRDGEWNLFRGQIDASWRLSSTFERVPRNLLDEENRKLDRFFVWVSEQKELKQYNLSEDKILAIAQHYGLKTMLVDFSTDPVIAAYFACDITEEHNPENPMAAILCVNTSDFDNIMSNCFPILVKDESVLMSEFLNLDVSNLWRLQAQRGRFLRCSLANIEHCYNFDRIIFPLNESKTLVPSKAQVYPVDQSELEKLLTRFFMNERLVRTDKVLRKIVKPDIIRRLPDENYDLCSWWPQGISESQGWDATDEWSVHRIEHADVLNNAHLISFSHDQTIEDCLAEIRQLFTSTWIKHNRDRTVRFEAANSSLKNVDLLCEVVRSLWNGMRTLPYTPEEISISFNKTLGHLQCRLNGSSLRFSLTDEALVDLGSDENGIGAYSRASISAAGLMDALHPEFREAAVKHLGLSGKITPHRLLLLQARPWQRFTFHGLRKLMIEEIIPTQVAYRVRKFGNDRLDIALFFNPVEIKVLGLA